MNSVEIPHVNHPIYATVEVPGSKSITNRALLVAALAQGNSILENALFSEDSEYFAKCLEQLGHGKVSRSSLLRPYRRFLS